MRRTAKGQMIDFDLIKVKQLMNDTPAPPEVSVRQQIIDRRLRKKASAMTPSPLNNPSNTEPDVLPDGADGVDTTLTNNEQNVGDNQEKSRRKQKTKQRQQSGEDDATDTTTT